MKGLIISAVLGKYKINLYEYEEDFEKDKDFSNFTYTDYGDMYRAPAERWVSPIFAGYLKDLPESKVDYLCQQKIKYYDYDFDCPSKLTWFDYEEEFTNDEPEESSLDTLIYVIDKMFEDHDNISDYGETMIILYSTVDAEWFGNCSDILPRRY